MKTVEEAIRELHSIEKRWQPYEDWEGSFDTAQEAWDYRIEDNAEPLVTVGGIPEPPDESKLSYFLTCSECARIERECMEDADEWCYKESIWPCKTITVVDNAKVSHEEG